MGALALAVALVLATGTASAACPNEAVRHVQGTTGLPSCMALEMISPPKKFGQGALLPNAFTPDGERALFYSTAGLAETPGLQKPFGDRYLATRGGSGWTTAATSPSTEAEIKTGGEPLGGPFAYSSDLTRWALLGGTQSQVGVGIFQIFSGGVGLPLSPLSTKAIPIDDTSDRDVIFSVANLLTMGTSADVSTTVVGSKLAFIAYLSGDPSGDVNEEPGLYANTYVAYRESGQPTFKLLTRDEADTGNVYGGRCGSRLGGGGGGISSGLNQGAIAPDGSRIYLTTRPDQPESVGTAGPPCDTDNPLRIMVFTKTPDGPSVVPLFEGGSTEGDDLYQGASADGEQVYFVTPRSLAPSDDDTPAPGASCGAGGSSSPACDLYVYDAELPEGERLIQASAGGTGDPDPGENAGVLSSITALSTDGTHAYFVAKGVLTTDTNPEGATAVNGQPNLYLYERNAENPDGRTAFIGTLASGDVSVLWGTNQTMVGGAYAVPMIGSSPEEGADGHILFVNSSAPLTSSDPDGNFRDVFRYDADAATLQLITAPSEEVLPKDMEVNSNNSAPHGALIATEGRWASEDGLTVGFSTAEQMLPSDTDGTSDPYVWKEGQLARFEGTPLPPLVSSAGDEVGFTSATVLLPQDGDSAMDAYVARVNGGFLPPPPPTLCNPLQEGSCQGLPSGVGAPNTATATFQGSGNVKAKPKPKPKKCKKGQVRRKGKCVKKKASKQKAGKSRKGGRK